MKRLTGWAVVILGAAMAMAQQPPAAGAGGGTRRARGAPDPAEGRRTGADPRQERADRRHREGTEGEARRPRPGGRRRGVRQGRPVFCWNIPELFGTQNAIDHSLVVLDQGIARAKQLSDGASPWNTGQEADPRLLFGDRRLGAAVRHHPAGGVRPGETGAALRLDARAAEQHHRIRVHLQPADLPAGQRAGGRPGADPARSVRADQRRGLALGGRGGRLRRHRGGQEALQDRRPARHAARLLDGRRRRVAHRAALSGSLRGGRNRRRDVVAPRADAGPRAVSVRGAEDLGKHGGVGAERLQSAAGRPRRRHRHADRVAARSAARHAQSRAVGIFAAHARAVGARGLPVRRRAGLSASERHSGHLPDLAEYGTRHQPAGPPAAGRLSEGVGRQGSDLARAHSLRHLHDALQPRLLGLGGRPGKALRARRHRCAARPGRRQVRDQDAQRVAPGAARDRTRASRSRSTDRR